MHTIPNKLNKLLICLITFIAISGPEIVFSDCGQNINSGIQKIIDEDRVKYRIPGIEITVSCPGEEFPRDFVSGTITIDGLLPIKTNHLFQIGSETKSFIAAIILQLETENALSINDPISKYLSNIPDQWQQVTIQQLLNHSSGIFNYTDVLQEMWRTNKDFDFKKQWGSDELINLVVNKPLYFESGKGWHYSNTNYVLAGMIIENVTGKTVDDEIKTRMIEPLHLSNTYYLPSLYSEQIMQQMAHGYSDDGFFPDEPKDITETNTSWANTAGAMVSTSHDMAIWFKNLLDGSLFPPKQMNELLTFVDGIFPDTSIQIGYGLGIIHDFDTFGEEALWHSGGTLGYNALMVWLKCNDVVITTNINHTTVNRDMYNITRDLASFIQKEDTSNICKMNFSEKGSEIPRQLKEYVDKASFAGINIL